MPLLQVVFFSTIANMVVFIILADGVAVDYRLVVDFDFTALLAAVAADSSLADALSIDAQLALDDVIPLDASFVLYFANKINYDDEETLVAAARTCLMKLAEGMSVFGLYKDLQSPGSIALVGEKFQVYIV